MLACLPKLVGLKGFAFFFGGGGRSRRVGSGGPCQAAGFVSSGSTGAKGVATRARLRRKTSKCEMTLPVPGGKENQEPALPPLQMAVQFSGSRTGILADLHGLEVQPILVTLWLLWLGVAAARCQPWPWWLSTCMVLRAVG